MPVGTRYRKVIVSPSFWRCVVLVGYSAPRGPCPVRTSRLRSKPPAVAVSAEKRWYQRFRSSSGLKVSIQSLKGGDRVHVWSPNASEELSRSRFLKRAYP